MPKPPPSIWKNWVHFVAFGFGVGTWPMPRTWACVVGTVLFLIFSHLPLTLYALLLLILFVLGVWVCEVTSSDLRKYSLDGIVFDQVVGVMVALYALPLTWKWVLLGFVVYRLFSIWKPWPTCWVKTNVMGGLGMMMDDVVAGLYTLIGLQLLLWLMGMAPL
ncbi:MAG: phosphatidylglycerophosphatase A [Gammaproteobacteria bacterium CG11_big_fil_rev_8_21_14_0_20_46_22]|nr:MAG: phosphatidylglycerophosphatase A [Gammaproteobacteria bacterium CG12_big_fil_rev_8_21_14_0_65_46_12]PIR10651.1 MAG: phosphatidylglycerophosphatase A [Gammaproteobacteria bacterium CG11_big_fil_rev_8_21_14_0_20_46_22]